MVISSFSVAASFTSIGTTWVISSLPSATAGVLVPEIPKHGFHKWTRSYLFSKSSKNTNQGLADSAFQNATDDAINFNQLPFATDVVVSAVVVTVVSVVSTVVVGSVVVVKNPKTLLNGSYVWAKELFFSWTLLVLKLQKSVKEMLTSCNYLCSINIICNGGF